MEIDYSEINYLKNPTWKELHADYEQCLLSMTGPTVIDIDGINKQRCRVFVTLLQGNEPSGFIAIHRWLSTRDIKEHPQTNLRFIICSVETASKRPLFSRRVITGNKDLNRCFDTPTQYSITQRGCYQRAKLIEQAIREVTPEAVIDLHNTNDPSPTFSVSYKVTAEALSLTSFFCNTLILSDLSLGTLMEQDFACPFITVECGGRLDEQAHEIAFSGITHIAHCKNIDYTHQEKNVEVVYRPLRLCTKDAVKLSYADHDEGYSGVTLKSNLTYVNFGGAQQNELLGWLDENGMSNLQLIDKKGNNVINDYFYSRDNQLVCRDNLRIFKATTDKQIALGDCLFYVAKHTENEK